MLMTPLNTAIPSMRRVLSRNPSATGSSDERIEKGLEARGLAMVPRASTLAELIRCASRTMRKSFFPVLRYPPFFLARMRRPRKFSNSSRNRAANGDEFVRLITSLLSRISRGMG